jgi:hypothetical protein
MEDAAVEQVVGEREVPELVDGEIPADPALQDDRRDHEQRPDGRPGERTTEARACHGVWVG